MYLTQGRCGSCIDYQLGLPVVSHVGPNDARQTNERAGQFPGRLSSRRIILQNNCAESATQSTYTTTNIANRLPDGPPPNASDFVGRSVVGPGQSAGLQGNLDRRAHGVLGLAEVLSELLV